jgi:hypothetical protein
MLRRGLDGRFLCVALLFLSFLTGANQLIFGRTQASSAS